VRQGTSRRRVLGERKVWAEEIRTERERESTDRGEGEIKYLEWRRYHRWFVIGSGCDNVSSPPVHGWNRQ
jgi:hypothetical protein